MRRRPVSWLFLAAVVMLVGCGDQTLTDPAPDDDATLAVHDTVDTAGHSSNERQSDTLSAPDDTGLVPDDAPPTDDVTTPPACVSAIELERGNAVAGECCPMDDGLIVDRPDGCNTCECGLGTEASLEWVCTDTTCGADTDSAEEDAVASPGDAVGPNTDTSAPATCPPEGAEVIEAAPPEAAPEGTCEPQPVAVTPSLTLGVVQGTDYASEFLYHVPEAPKGLLLVFHGGGGSKEDAFGRTEFGLLLLAAIDAGYAVAALDSVAHIAPTEGGKKKWDEEETPCNPDIRNVVAMVTQLKSPDQLALIPPAAPLYAFGVSNGGSMVSRTAQHIDFSAVTVYITNAKQFHDTGATIPPVFIVAGSQDTTVGTTGPCLLYQNATSQGIDTGFRLNVPQAVTPGLFTRIAGIDCALSLSIFQDFQGAEIIDAAGMVTIVPSNLDAWLPALTQAATAYAPAIKDLLDERLAVHTLTSDFRNETVAFFEAHATADVPQEMPTCP